MTTSPIEHWPALAQSVHVTGDTLTVDLADGRSISVPILWYPRLAHGTPDERGNWRLIGRGEGIHWPDLDEDVSVENLLFMLFGITGIVLLSSRLAMLAQAISGCWRWRMC